MVDARHGGGEVPSSTKVDSPPNADAPRPEDSNLDTAVAPNAPDDMASSKAPSKASSTRTSTPVAATLEDGETLQTANGSPAPTEQALQSQPMSATVSSSSDAPTKEPKEVPAAPYGTRSRNRPERKSRVNYAEDVEMDFEMAPDPTNGNGSEPPSRGSAATESAQSAGAGGKKGAGAGQGNASWGASGPNAKDIPSNANTPGTSTFTASPAATPAPQPQPKRRKNAASHATNASHANGAAPSQPAAKRAQNAVAVGSSQRETNMLTFENSGARLKDGCLVADDGQTVAINDQVYLVCEPPGEPYYLCRVMEFIHTNNDPLQKVEMLRVNWFYRPRDVQRYNNDTRLVYATMHSDLCPLTSLRGKCQILHRSEIDDLDDYRKTKDSFWFNQVFDRFIHRWYDVIPTSQVINVPDKVKKALDERWKYICLETSRVKELTSAVKSCKRCVGFCATNDSVECAVCRNTYHMNCVRPPLLKKPSRGFAWACGPCSRAQEKKLEARRTPLLGSGGDEGEDEEMVEDEEEEANAETTAPSPNDSETQIDLHPGTQAEIALAKMWPMRYLGIHCRVEDALQYDDRAIYPRASSRLGPRHQANVNVWHGRPVELVKPAEIKKRYVKAAGHKKDTKLSKETVAAIEADKAEKAKRPKWVMDEPPGYVRRGEDYPNKDPKCTAEVVFKMPPLGVHSTRGEDSSPSITPEQVETYMTRAKGFAKSHVGVEPFNTNFLTKCLALLTKHQYDVEAALKAVKKLDKRKDLKEPELTKEEEKKWNEGVSKYGSEIRSVRLHTSKTMHYGDAVRYYYMWKKTPKGKEIWGSYSNRKGKSKKTESDPQSRLVDDIADDQDDSAFDHEKAVQRKRNFQCKFCNNRHSRQWRRAPGASPGQTVTADGRTSKDKANGYVVALCQRCANLWRKYAVKWENTEEIARKVAQGGGKAWKRRFDEELLREVYAATTDSGPMNGMPEYVEPPAATVQATIEQPPKKKQKTAAIGAADSGTSTPLSEAASKKKEKEKPLAPPKAPTPPPVPAQPRLRVLPCAVCRQTEGTRLECAACRMNVHKACYGIEDLRQANKWYCDTCKNDKKESVSYVSGISWCLDLAANIHQNYECVLCPLRHTEPDLYEPPKVSHKKKTDREREKERLEKELVEKAKDEYRIKQQEKGRPVVPREPLKRTADNNWVHVYCALWHPETKFSSAVRLDMVEGIGAPTLRYDAMCKLCKSKDGACVTCQQCHANFHVGCAHNAGYTFGFDMTPVKATRRDAVPTVTLNGETGTMMAAIWCKDHTPKTVVHPMHEEVEGTDLTALQLFAREFKQADLTLTGTARKANLVDQSTRVVPPAPALAQSNRRTSTVTAQTPVSARGRPSNAGLIVKEEEPPEPTMAKPERKCIRCKIDASPRWWKVEDNARPEQNGVHAAGGPLATNGVESSSRPLADHAPQSDHLQSTNGAVDRPMMDAPPVASHDHPSHLRVNTDVGNTSSTSYLCQKCHWKKLNAPDEPEERERSVSVHPEAAQLPLRSPPAQSFVAPPPPPALGGSWWLVSYQERKRYGQTMQNQYSYYERPNQAYGQQQQAYGPRPDGTWPEPPPMYNNDAPPGYVPPPGATKMDPNQAPGNVEMGQYPPPPPMGAQQTGVTGESGFQQEMPPRPPQAKLAKLMGRFRK
ncbi:putative PHD type zinc finger protein with BAH domain-containing protein [Paraconiothyrium brasiliense]|uniref:PHD type zinc finger protein with BAH domain-containing protein n=1 Tax=Paraconiothyrium brasiliense TaxID=300254 RepID=A0ABR3RH22_9PLEO